MTGAACYACTSSRQQRVMEAVLLYETLVASAAYAKTVQDLITDGAGWADKPWIEQSAAKTFLWCSIRAAIVGAPIQCTAAGLYEDVPCWSCVNPHTAYTVYLYYVAAMATASGVADVTKDALMASSTAPCFDCLSDLELRIAVLTMMCDLNEQIAGTLCSDYTDEQLFADNICCNTDLSFIGLWTLAAESAGGGVAPDSNFRLLQDLSYRLLEDGTSRRLLSV